MVKITKREITKLVPFRCLDVNDIFYYDERYWVKMPLFREYDESDLMYNAHTIGDGDCDFMEFHKDTEVLIGDAEIITNF